MIPGGCVRSKILSFQRLASRRNAPPKKKRLSPLLLPQPHTTSTSAVNPPLPPPLSLFSHYHHYFLLLLFSFSSPLLSLSINPSNFPTPPPKKGAIWRASFRSYPINCNRLAAIRFSVFPRVCIYSES
ncbi:hypothetical protein K440DRAFT_108782 [Wilcoxina mikolae CBS 423.85]|nr:hypothetical protein K440DRAFT_108782 [Wilcoxina mikolae CBS 423.85]